KRGVRQARDQRPAGDGAERFFERADGTGRRARLSVEREPPERLEGFAAPHRLARGIVKEAQIDVVRVDALEGVLAGRLEVVLLEVLPDGRPRSLVADLAAQDHPIAHLAEHAAEERLDPAVAIE